MATCAVILWLILMPSGGQFPHRYEEISVVGCQVNRVESVSVHDNKIKIENKTSRYTVPLPKVAEQTEQWVVVDLTSQTMDLKPWGLVQIRKGPKQPL